MPWEVLRDSLPYLAVLAYVLVERVMAVLAAHRRRAIAVHERALQARAMRRDYLQSLPHRTFDARRNA